ncbi:MAG: septum formation initiator family protein, partial [Clostridiales bacterium]|nr:septum formation initiator family protein [Clostridiales bacterium]
KVQPKTKEQRVVKPCLWVAYVVAGFAMFGVFGAGMFSSLVTNKELLASKAELEKSVEEEKERKAELSMEGDYYKSDESYEKIAREKLGLVMPNEIQFIDQNK